ncbi:nucleoside-diphosphate sugar epimerase/dehydratase [Daejeonella oryzae]|uniref:nucleoside-diphosphate sugar epimerase/dehydratase n=1 Tax=Daejeonella oryzae TaxID=1122943 RepID=UPI00042A5193|nr:nucleoside-diphosphate sugar epimerase/dehydratase [Daejeonella oryzae]
MKNIIYGERALSKWLIFLIDQIIISWAFAVSFFIVMQFEFNEILRGSFFIYSGLYTLIAICVFIRMRIHTGIIRYSNTEDIFRIFSSVLLLSILYAVVVNALIIPYFNLAIKQFPLVVVLNFFISTSLLIMLRIGVKSFFGYIKNMQKGDKEVVLIYGSDSSSILLKQALEVKKQNRFEIIGFIDDDFDKVNKYIEQKKVYPTSSIETLKKKFKISSLVVMSNCLNVDGKKRAIEKCMEQGIVVQTVPPADQWLYGKLQLNQIRNLRIEDLLQREAIILKKNNILNEITGKRVLITGAAGSIGSEIVRQVLSYNPQQVILCDQAESPLHELQLEVEDNFPGAKTAMYIADIQNERRVRAMFKHYKPQIVFHAAAYKHVPMMENNPTEAINTNVLGTKILADISIEYKVDKFIMISTDKAVNPTNVMGASKRIAEIYIQSLNKPGKNNEVPTSQTRFITTRFGNVLGSNGSVISRFQSQIEKGGPVTVTHPEITRYFMTIPEAVQLVMEAAAIGNGGEIFVFDMGTPVKIVDLAKNMIKLSGLIPDKDVEIVFSGLRPGEKLYEELLNKEEHSIPTHHQKIKISRVITYPFHYVDQVINELVDLNDLGDDYEVVKKMKEIVPEFKSNNSVYEKLDIFNLIV